MRTPDHHSYMWAETVATNLEAHNPVDLLGKDQGRTGETMSLGWPGNASGRPKNC